LAAECHAELAGVELGPQRGLCRIELSLHLRRALREQ
jgi:hypothetical protein